MTDETAAQKFIKSYLHQDNRISKVLQRLPIEGE
jgi:hypothetical protein